MQSNGHGLAGARIATGRLPAEGVIARLREDGGAILAGTVLPFSLVVYLALSGGGYDSVVRGEVGIAVWWIVLLGALVGVLPAGRIGALGWIGLATLAAFALWTALGIGWSESAERSVTELARVATYLGVLALALSVHGLAGLRRVVRALAAAIALVALLALLSRLHPSWFPANETAELLPSAQARLAYPLNYWNGLAALIAIGLPLVLTVASESRRLLTQALATAVVPAMALAAFYTLSRGGAIEIAVALVAFLALYPRRLAALPVVALAAGGSALLIGAAAQRDALADGLSTPVALAQGDEMLATLLVVCTGVALVRVAVGLAARYGAEPRISIRPAAAAGALGAALAIGLTAAIASGAPAGVSDAWEEFKDPVGAGGDVSRFESASGNGRYQYWESSADANATDPLLGTGPGGYELWWAREGTLPGFVRDAHSLYLEALGELGVVGLALICAVVLGTVGVGVWRTATSVRRRPWLAGATAACAAFALAAAIDWVWELAVIPVAFLLLAAPLLADPRRRRTGRGPVPARLALGGLAVCSLLAIGVPMIGAQSLRESQSAARQGDLERALERARRAGDVQSYAASPALQEALVLELRGDLDGAAAAARRATEREATNWRTWLVLSRIEAYRGRAPESVEAYRRARSLNPRSALFAADAGGAGSRRQ